jgi:predicted AlkP superfamily pyrophosphatase or phosphodiesterase
LRGLRPSEIMKDSEREGYDGSHDSAGSVPEIRPVYDGLCISRMLHNIGSILEGSIPDVPEAFVNSTGKKHLVLLIADGMGLLNIKENMGKLPFLAQLNAGGSLAAGTSVFPSTTAASVTSLFTASDPCSHGLLEWYLYLDEAEMVIETLPFVAHDPAEAARFRSLDLDIRLLFEGTPYMEKLAAQRVACTAVMPLSITGSAFSSAVLPPARIIGYETLDDVLPMLSDGGEGRRLTVVYYPGVDTEGHVHGPSSDSYVNEMKRVDSFLRAFGESRTGETSLILTADHGQTEIDPDAVLYLDELDWFDDMLAADRSGRAIPPYGSPRDVIIRCRNPGRMKGRLDAELRDIAAVAESHRLAAEGYFGRGGRAKSLSSRIGDLWLLPNPGAAVWYRHFDGERVTLRGMHGGLTAREMLIPIASV